MIMEKIKHIGLYPCPFGFFRIVEEEDAVVAIDVVKERQEEERPSEVTDWAARELHEYLEGERRAFTFPYRLVGTPFRLQVWKELEKVPYGETTTYKRLAEAIGRPGPTMLSAAPSEPIPWALSFHATVSLARTAVSQDMPGGCR